jgi:hypothetical protein
MKIKNINWDCEFKEDKKQLPKEIEIDVDELIGDYLLDKFGYQASTWKTDSDEEINNDETMKELTGMTDEEYIPEYHYDRWGMKNG